MGLETIFGKGEKERNAKKKKLQRERFTLQSHVPPPSFSPSTVSPARAAERKAVAEKPGWALGVRF